MLTRTEILEALHKMGFRRMIELKRCCRHYERFQAADPGARGQDSRPFGLVLGGSEPRIPAPPPL